MRNFLSIFENQTRLGTKIYVPDYLETGNYPIVDQSRKLICGYKNEPDGLYTNTPFIVFGDVTRTIKYIDFPCYLGADGSVILKVKDKNYSTKYLYYYLLHQYIPNAGYNRHYKYLKDLSFKQPTLDEQNMQVKVLDKLNELIKKCEIEIELYNELIKSRFIELFGNPDLSVQKAEWPPLGSLTKIYTGTTPSTEDETLWNGKYSWVTPAELNEDSFYVYDTVRKLTEKGIKSKSLSIMPINTVLLSTRAPIGKVAIVGKPMACNQGFKNFLCDKKLNHVFLYTLLKFNSDYLNSIGSGTTFKEISKTKIQTIKIPVPGITKQNDFASFVEQVDKLKFNVKKRIELYQELLNKKMDEYFN